MSETPERRGAATADRQVTTLNRKAIMLALMIVAVTIMVATFFLSPATNRDRRGPADQVSADQVGDAAMQQNFMASPPDTVRFRADQLRRQRAASANAPAMADSIGAMLDAAAGRTPSDQAFDVFAAQAIERQNPRAQMVSAQPAEHPAYAYGHAAHFAAPSMGGLRSAINPQQRAETPRNEEELAFERAMSCGIRGCPPAVQSGGTAPAGPRDTSIMGLEALSHAMAQHGRAMGSPTVEGGEPPPNATPAAKDRYEAFLEAASNAGTDTYVAATVQEPISPYQIMAGTLIPVTLVTAINSDLPGHVIAQVTRNVYDTQQRHLLIPAGARFLGKVDNQVIRGQSRVNIAWTRLVYPNNRSLSLPAMVGMDREGAVGIRDRVNNHTGRTFFNALLLSAISAGAQVSQPRQGSVLAAPSAGEVTAGAAGQQLSQVSAEMIRKNMNTSPTLHVRQGFNFYVYVSKDLVLEPYEL